MSTQVCYRYPFDASKHLSESCWLLINITVFDTLATPRKTRCCNRMPLRETFATRSTSTSAMQDPAVYDSGRGIHLSGNDAYHRRLRRVERQVPPVRHVAQGKSIYWISTTGMYARCRIGIPHTRSGAETDVRLTHSQATWYGTISGFRRLTVWPAVA